MQSRRVEILRFTRALFGLAPSPFLLGGVIKQHLEACRTENPDLVREIEKSLYVDDLISGGPTVKAALEVKAGVTHVFNQASFKLHKWHSNVPAVESPGESLSEDTTFAKEQLGAPQEGGGSILGGTGGGSTQTSESLPSYDEENTLRTNNVSEKCKKKFIKKCGL